MREAPVIILPAKADSAAVGYVQFKRSSQRQIRAGTDGCADDACVRDDEEAVNRLRIDLLQCGHHTGLELVKRFTAGWSDGYEVFHPRRERIRILTSDIVPSPIFPRAEIDLAPDRIILKANTQPRRDGIRHHSAALQIAGQNSARLYARGFLRNGFNRRETLRGKGYISLSDAFFGAGCRRWMAQKAEQHLF